MVGMGVLLVAVVAAGLGAGAMWLLAARGLFARAAAEGLDRNAGMFVGLAGSWLAQQQATTVGPLQDALERMEVHIAGMERARGEAYAGLVTQVRGLAESQDRLRAETSNLVGALRSPQARGPWGDAQLGRGGGLAGLGGAVAAVATG